MGWPALESGGGGVTGIVIATNSHSWYLYRFMYKMEVFIWSGQQNKLAILEWRKISLFKSSCFGIFIEILANLVFRKVQLFRCNQGQLANMMHQI